MSAVFLVGANVFANFTTIWADYPIRAVTVSFLHFIPSFRHCNGRYSYATKKEKSSIMAAGHKIVEHTWSYLTSADDRQKLFLFVQTALHACIKIQTLRLLHSYVLLLQCEVLLSLMLHHHHFCPL